MRADIGGDVLALAPSPRVAAADQPAVLVAQRQRQAVDLRLGGEDEPASSARPRKRRTRATNSTTSSSAKALSSDSIGTRWRPWRTAPAGAAPTRRDGLSARISSGKRASIASLRAAQRVVVGVGDVGASSWW